MARRAWENPGEMDGGRRGVGRPGEWRRVERGASLLQVVLALLILGVVAAVILVALRRVGL
jgi:hypothetical protein